MGVTTYGPATGYYTGSEPPVHMGRDVHVMHANIDYKLKSGGSGSEGIHEIIKVAPGTLVLGVDLVVLEVYDGSAVINLGDGSDVDGWIPAASIDLTTLGLYGGAQLHEDGTSKLLDKVGAFPLLGGKYYAAADTIDVKYDCGTAAKGKAVIVVRYIPLYLLGIPGITA